MSFAWIGSVLRILFIILIAYVVFFISIKIIYEIILFSIKVFKINNKIKKILKCYKKILKFYRKIYKYFSNILKNTNCFKNKKNKIKIYPIIKSNVIVIIDPSNNMELGFEYIKK